MQALISSLRNYVVAPNELDLNYVMQHLAGICVAYYAQKAYPPRKKLKVMKELFAESLKIGSWPTVLQGEHNENFKIKTDAYLAKVNKDYKKTAEAMAKQVKNLIDQLAG
ncbi:MAG: hypothetical protein MJZ05_12065 [Fibrobacter sp.]|nr:hypothetical protein [Fibrobacter sp.]